MRNKIKNRILTIIFFTGITLILISLVFANSSKKLTIQVFSQSQKALDKENNYQNIDTGIYYKTLAEALNTVASNQTIRVLNSVEETIAPTLALGKTGVKLDMNGQTTELNEVVMTNNGAIDIYNSSLTEGKLTGSGTRTIINAGTLTTNGTSSTNKLSLVNTSAVASARVILNDVGKSATLNSNTYLSFTTATTGYRYVLATNGNVTIAGANIINKNLSKTELWDRGIQVSNSAGKITITSGTIDTSGTAVIASNATVGASAVTAIEILGGTITSIGEAGVYNNHKINKVLISGGTVTSISNMAVYNNSTGEINVTGGTITGGKFGIANSTTGTINVSGSTTQVTGGTGAGIRGYTGTVNVAGGTITGEKDGIYITTQNNVSGTVTVTGGTIIGKMIGANVEGTLNFYDGVIISKSGRKSIVGTVTTTPTGYAVVKTYDDETTTEKAILSPENLLIPTRIGFDKISGKIIKGTNFKLQATIYSDTAIIETSVLWASSNENIARVNQNGVITGVNQGKCQVTATTENGEIAIFEAEVVGNEYVPKAIREVANAYYNKGTNGQYCSPRLSRFYSPEEATSQHTIYSVCSNFAFSAYYQAFGIKLPFITHELITYANKYYDINNITTNDVIEYWIKTTNDSNNTIYKDNNGNIKDLDLSTDNGRREYASKILKEYNLQVGDIICYCTGIENSNTGHALIVYDILYNENGEPIDAIIRESSDAFEKKTTKITKGLSYLNMLNENHNIYEGTFRELYLANSYRISYTTTRNPVVYNFRNMSYFTILRPLLKDENGNYTGKYYYATFEPQTGIPPAGYVCTGRNLTDYSMTSSTLNRIDYSGIDIEKTVDVFNNSVVGLGDELEYTIRITNKGKYDYSSFDIVENIPNYVEIVNVQNATVSENKITWRQKSLKQGETAQLKYKVKVKNDALLLGKEIISTGTVAGIPSSTVKNKISNNLDENDKLIIKDKAESTINSNKFTGQELISKIYKDALGIDIKIEDLDITDLIKTRNATTYYPENALFTSSVRLNVESIFSNIVLNTYYGALYTNSSGTVDLKAWENASYLESRDQRADTIYKENFQTGDVLVYKNTQTASNSVTYKTENGTYYLIYISEEDKITVDGQELYGFIGINDNKEINHIATDYTSLQTLLGKDYYVILRPSMAKLQIDFEDYSELNKNEKKYIENVAPKTTLGEFTNRIRTNGDIQIVKDNTKITNKETKISTGMKLKITLNSQVSEYTIIVKGDTNGDGECDLKDLLQVNKHRLNKIQLENEYFRAGDVNNDGEVNIKDILRINKFRLGKIKKL